jgi:mono/diheme cytochrome c family protein
MIATTKPLASRAAVLIAIVGMLVACALLFPILQAQTAGDGGAYFVPGDPKLGMRAFFDKGCARCHSVLGEGGRSAPDLARAPAGHLSSAELLAAMWNHAPSMWEKMRVEGVSPSKFTEGDMSNLFAFLYSVRSLDEPGDPGRGRRLLEDKHCLQCHRAGGTGGGSGPDLAKWAGYRNPVSWVQAMWNHAPAMQSRMSAQGVKWPQFAGNDVSDLIAYIRMLSPNASKPTYLRPADPKAGSRIFREKGCSSCHAIGSSGSSGAPDLRSRALPRTLGQFAAAMWNHAPAMRASMQAQNIPRPQFTHKEMADLIAYLFAERYFEPAGNVARGARLFDEKGCSACHRAGGVGPQLAHASFSPSHMAAALWNHGPIMFQTMQQQQIAWPRFQPGEVVDLIEFLSSRAAPTRAMGGPR